MLRLLLVEDDDDTRKGLLDYIPWQDIGVDEVITAVDGQEALKIAIEMEPDIILTDVRMPRLDGIQLSIKLRELFPHCIIIFLSGYSDKEYLKTAISVRAFNYVEKPVDIDEIKAVILEAVNSCTIEKKIVTHTMDLVKQELAIGLTIKDNIDNIYEELAIAKINFPKEGKYVTILGRIDESSPEIDLSSYSGNIINLIQGILPEICLDYLIAIKNDYYIIIHIYCDEINENAIRLALQNVIHSLEKDCHKIPAIFFSVGASVTSLDKICESYQSAVFAAQELFFIGYGNIVFFTENRIRIDHYNVNLSEKFRNLLRENKKTEALAFIDMLCLSLKDETNILITQIKNIFFALSIQIMKVADERDVDEFKSLENSEECLWEQFYSFNTLDSINSYLHERIEAFFSCMEGRSYRSKLIRQILSYVQTNYQRVSLKDISNVIHLTPSYLCLIFKNETGKTINQYITEYRINRAKELLRNRQMKLLEVASEVGYLDANYFTRLFKKIVGVTPSEYREKYI